MSTKYKIPLRVQQLENPHPFRMETVYEVAREFVLERESVSEIDIIEGIVKTDGQMADILFAVEKIGNPAKMEFRIFDPENSEFVDIDRVNGNGYLVPYRFVELNFVLMKYEFKPSHLIPEDRILKQENQSFELSNGQNSQSQGEEDKKQRSGERTIGQVLELVRRWRDIFDTSTKIGRSRINLQEAAKIIGISKKSLDDYYYQLRIGEYNHFEFQDNLDQKIGVLRGFIKLQSGSKREKHQIKYPKKLKILEKPIYFREEQNIGIPAFTNAESKPHEQEKENQSPGSTQDHYFDNIEVFKKLEEESYLLEDSGMKDLENRFFGNFQFLMDEPKDPFFNYQLAMEKKNFKRENPFDKFF